MQLKPTWEEVLGTIRNTRTAGPCQNCLETPHDLVHCVIRTIAAFCSRLLCSDYGIFSLAPFFTQLVSLIASAAALTRSSLLSLQKEKEGPEKEQERTTVNTYHKIKIIAIKWNILIFYFSLT